jgi:hypothetical protein
MNPPAGTYTTTYTPVSGNTATCQTPATTTTTYPTDSGAGDGGLPAGCTETCSGSTLTLDCTTTASGYTSTVTITFTESGTGATGSETLVVTTADGGVYENCSYTISVVKQ